MKSQNAELQMRRNDDRKISETELKSKVIINAL